jgi:uncharacterized protein (DUF952 family)
MEFHTAEESREASVAYHLVPAPVWEERGGAATYLPEAWEQDGFIHTTNGLDPLLEVANMFYTGDARPYMVLVLDTTRLTSELRYDDEARVYPHIYGPLNTDAVIGTLSVDRDAEGRFTGFHPA